MDANARVGNGEGQCLRYDRRHLTYRLFQVIISPQASHAISLMFTHFRYTVSPSFVEKMMALKNETELEGLRRAYVRDGVAFVRHV